MKHLTEEETLKVIETAESTVSQYPISADGLVAGIVALGELATLGFSPETLVETIEYLQQEAIQMSRFRKHFIKE